MLAHKVLDSIFDGTVMPLYNGGEMRRDWTYVDDIVSGVVAAADRRLGYEIINLGRGEPVLLGDFVRQLERLAQRRAHFVNEPMMLADVDHTFADIAKARRLLDYDPKVSVEQGNAAFYEWYVRVVRSA
jgi:UDP-glucuronate 4-epimerase